MILGIVSVLCCGLVLVGVAAVITGHLAQRSQPYAKGFWLTGIICGYASILLGILYWGFQIALFLGTGAMSYYSFN
jgi:hypothetical protein